MPSITRESCAQKRQGEALTVERLKEVLHYDPTTGVFTWLKSRGRLSAGSPAGYICLGYVKIRLDGKNYQAHRLAWFYMTGSWPDDQVDHRDLNKANNCWNNLRAATGSQNQQNVALRRNNKSGFKGIIPRRGKWVARIRVEGKQVWLDTYDCRKTAAEAYAAAARQRFGDFARVA